MNTQDNIHATNTFTTGVLLVNLGSPEAPEPVAVSRYLKQFLQDRRVVEVPRIVWFFVLRCIIMPFRSPRLAKLYARIWTDAGSPLVAETINLSQKLATQYSSNYPNSKVAIAAAMRYGKPDMAESLMIWQKQGLERLIVLPLYPQYAASTCASIFDQLARILAGMRWLPHVHFINGYHDNSIYIKAVAESIKQAGNNNHFLLLSFHGLPIFMLEQGDPYYCFCHSSARLIALELGLQDDQWQLTFQSRFGKQPWLQPYTDIRLRQLAEQGIDEIRVACPGFAVDCLETLEEINVENRNIFMKAGGKEYTYIPCLNSSPAQVKLMQSLIQPVLDQWEATDKNRIITTGSERLKRYNQALSEQKG